MTVIIMAAGLPHEIEAQSLLVTLKTVNGIVEKKTARNLEK